MFWNYIEVVIVQHCECSQYHWMVHFKMVNFMIYDCYLNLKKEVGTNNKYKKMLWSSPVIL